MEIWHGMVYAKIQVMDKPCDTVEPISSVGKPQVNQTCFLIGKVLDVIITGRLIIMQLSENVGWRMLTYMGLQLTLNVLRK